MLQAGLWGGWKVRTGDVGGDVALWLVLGWVKVAWIWDIWLGSTVLCLAHQLLSARRKLTNGVLGHLGSMASLLSCDVAELAGLLIDDGTSVVEVVVNELLVLEVDKRSKVDDGGEDKRNSPGWSELDEEVCEKSSGECLKMSDGSDVQTFAFVTYTNGSVDVLGKDNTLKLDDEEVDKLLGVLKRGLEGLTRDSVVLARAHLRCNTTVEDQLTSSLSSGNDCCCQLKLVCCSSCFLLPRRM